MTYKYDAFGRQVESFQTNDSYPRTTATQYDADGRVKSVATDDTVAEDTLHYEYDPATGLQTATWTGTARISAISDISYGYDELGA